MSKLSRTLEVHTTYVRKRADGRATESRPIKEKNNPIGAIVQSTDAPYSHDSLWVVHSLYPDAGKTVKFQPRCIPNGDLHDGQTSESTLLLT